MKIWIKLLIGAIIGITVGFFLPEDQNSVLFFIENIIIQTGRFLLFPLVLFGTTIGVYELNKDGIAWKAILRLFGYIAVFSLAMVLLGVAAVLLLVPDRIPIIAERVIQVPFLSFGDYLGKIVPSNFFHIFTEPGSILLPLLVFAVFFGLNLDFDRIVTRPLVQIFDSFSRTFFHMNRFIYEIIGIGFIAFGAALVMRVRFVDDFSLFAQLFVIIGITTVIVIFGIIPALLYFLGERSNPYKLIFAVFGAVLTAALSGDALMGISASINHAKENLGIPRRINSTTLPIAALFSKPGTGMVSAIGFILILKSYSSLGIGFFDVLWIILLSFLLCFCSSTEPRMSVLVSLSTMCTLFGRGVEEGFLILNPVMPLLIGIAVLLDVLVGNVITYLIGVNLHLAEPVKTKEYI